MCENKQNFSVPCHSMTPSYKYDYNNSKIRDNEREISFENISTSKTEAKTKIWASCVAAALFYGICSFSMAFINKAVVSSYKFNFPFFIMSCQMMLTILFLEILRFKGFIILNSYSFKKGRSFFWPALFFAIHSVTALTSLSGMTIPMYSAIKRCAPFSTFALSIVIFHKKMPSIYISISVCLITIGCIIAGIGDLSFNILAYTHGLISVIAQSLYLLLVQHCAENDMSTLEILHLNSYNTVLFFFLISLTTNEFNHIIHFSEITDYGFLSCFFTQLCIGSILNYSVFLCITFNSALTTSFVGVMKSAVQTLIGFMTFGGVKFHPLNIIGIVLNTCGGFIYTHARYKEKQGRSIIQKIEEKEEILLKGYVSNGIHYKLSFDRGCKSCL